MIVVKLVGEKYDKGKLQENSIRIRKWFAIQCIEKKNLDLKYYEISENDDIDKK